MDRGTNEDCFFFRVHDDLLSKIFDALLAKERAQLEVVCKSWKEVSRRTWTSLEVCAKSQKQLDAQSNWLSHLPHLRSLQWHSTNFYPAEKPEVLSSILRLESFVHLQQLHLCHPRVFSCPSPRNSYFLKTNLMLTPANLQCLRPLQNLKSLKMVYKADDKEQGCVSSMSEFTIFPNLQHLAIAAYPSQSLVLMMSEEAKGLSSLKTLTLGMLDEIVVTGALETVMGCLESLKILGLSKPILDDVGVPALTHLTYELKQNEYGQHKIIEAVRRLPFKTSDQLKQLATSFKHLPDHLPSLSPHLTEVSLSGGGWAKYTDVQLLTQFRHLSNIGIDKLAPTSTSLLEFFQEFPRLRTLDLPMDPYGAQHNWQHLLKGGVVAELSSLKVSGKELVFDGNLENLPSLRVYDARLAKVHGHLKSSTLKKLHFQSTKFMKHSVPLKLGYLPQLHTLQMTCSFKLGKEIRAVAEHLGALPSLRNLSLRADYGLYEEAVEAFSWKVAWNKGDWENAEEVFLDDVDFNKEDIEAMDAGFIATVLQSLTKCRPSGLERLTLQDMESSVQLSRKCLPQVKILAIWCNSMELDSSCGPDLADSFHLRCSENKTNEATLQRLQASQGIQILGRDVRKGPAILESFPQHKFV